MRRTKSKSTAPSLQSVTRAPLNVDPEDWLLRRAFTAWFKAGGPYTDQPSNMSTVEAHASHWYVVLRNVRGTMAVYRVKNDGMLKRLRRWPSSIEGGAR